MNSSWIIHRLRTTGKPLVFRVHRRLGTWNPAESDRKKRLHQEGWATYELDEENNVHLQLSTEQATTDYRGPVPAAAEDPRSRRPVIIMQAVTIGYGAFLFIGGLVGDVLSGGSGTRHIVLASLGVFAAALVASIASTVLQVGDAVRKTLYDYR